MRRRRIVAEEVSVKVEGSADVKGRDDRRAGEDLVVRRDIQAGTMLPCYTLHHPSFQACSQSHNSGQLRLALKGQNPSADRTRGTLKSRGEGGYPSKVRDRLP
jgi:hypothetical protein